MSTGLDLETDECLRSSEGSSFDPSEFSLASIGC